MQLTELVPEPRVPRVHHPGRDAPGRVRCAASPALRTGANAAVPARVPGQPRGAGPCGPRWRTPGRSPRSRAAGGRAEPALTCGERPPQPRRAAPKFAARRGTGKLGAPAVPAPPPAEPRRPRPLLPGAAAAAAPPRGAPGLPRHPARRRRRRVPPARSGSPAAPRGAERSLGSAGSTEPRPAAAASGAGCWHRAGTARGGARAAGCVAGDACAARAAFLPLASLAPSFPPSPPALPSPASAGDSENAAPGSPPGTGPGVPPRGPARSSPREPAPAAPKTHPRPRGRPFPGPGDQPLPPLPSLPPPPTGCLDPREGWGTPPGPRPRAPTLRLRSPGTLAAGTRIASADPSAVPAGGIESDWGRPPGHGADFASPGSSQAPPRSNAWQRLRLRTHKLGARDHSSELGHQGVQQVRVTPAHTSPVLERGQIPMAQRQLGGVL